MTFPYNAIKFMFGDYFLNQFSIHFNTRKKRGTFSIIRKQNTKNNFLFLKQKDSICFLK